jgi:hypothetical protein
MLWKADSHSACQATACLLDGTQRFITVLTKVRHWTLSWASRIQFVPSIPISLRSILMLSSHLRLGLPSGLLPSSLCSFLHDASSSLLGPNILNTLFSKLSVCVPPSKWETKFDTHKVQLIKSQSCTFWSLGFLYQPGRQKILNSSKHSLNLIYCWFHHVILIS